MRQILGKCVADIQLYKRPCLSIGPLVHWSVRTPYSVGKTIVLEAPRVCVCVGRWVRSGWGLAAPAYPSAITLRPCVIC